MKRKILLILMLLLLVSQSADAMVSPGYRIDWNNLLSGSGGSASSAAYQASITTGQTVSGIASSPGYTVHLGYWSGVPPAYTIFLSRVMKGP